MWLGLQLYTCGWKHSFLLEEHMDIDHTPGQNKRSNIQYNLYQSFHIYTFHPTWFSLPREWKQLLKSALKPWSVTEEGTWDKIKHLELNHARDNVVNDRHVLPNQHDSIDDSATELLQFWEIVVISYLILTTKCGNGNLWILILFLLYLFFLFVELEVFVITK